MTSSTERHGVGPTTDRGGILPIAMVIITVFGLLVVAMASYARASLRFTGVVRDRNERHIALEGATRLALDMVRYGSYSCTSAPSTILSITLNAEPVSVQCTRQDSVVNQWVLPAVVITQANGFVVGEDNSAVSGDFYFAVPPTSIGHTLVVDDGDIWMGSNNCATWTPTTITKLTVSDPEERSYQCASSNWASIFPAPTLPAVPADAPASILINTNQCRVFFPGRYSSTNVFPSFDGSVDVYLKSGLYYFDNIGQVKIKNTTVVGGLPGEASNEDELERIWLPGCANAATDPLVNDTSTGVTVVLGGNSNIKLDDNGALELFAPANGYSIVAYASLTNGYAAAIGTDDKLDQERGAVRVHGKIWAPGSSIVLGAPTPAVRTVANEVPSGGQLFGGVVVRKLELKKRPTDGGYNMQVDTVEPHFKVLLVATGTGNTLRVVADARPSWYEIAITSWWLS